MKDLKKLFEDIKKNGGQAYIVGGYVRDRILGITSKDIDIEVFNINPSTLEPLLSSVSKWRKVGKYEIYLLKKGYEVSFPRNKQDIIDPYVSVKEASKRRDLTINSIYYDLLEDRYIDYYGGIEDIEAKRLIYTDYQEFSKDPLRILRLIGFLSRLQGFYIAPDLEEFIKEHLSSLKNLKKERIFIELEKILIKGEYIEKAFDIAKELGIIKVLFPQLDNASIDYQLLSYEERRIDLSLAILLLNIPDYRSFLCSISDDKKLLGRVISLIENYDDFERLVVNPERIAIKKLAIASKVEDLKKIYEQKKGKTNNIDILWDIYMDIKDNLSPLLKGRDLINIGYEATQELGIILDELYELQIEEVYNTKEELIQYAKKSLDHRQI